MANVVKRALPPGRRYGHGLRAALLAASILIAPLVATEVRAQATGPFLYVPNFGDGTVSVIDTFSNTLSAPALTVGTAPATVAVSGDESVAYVANNSSNTVSVINTATNAVLTTVAVGNNPAGVAVSPNGANVYVTNFNSGTVSVINAATNTVISTVNIGGNPYGVALSPNGAFAYVANNQNNSVSVINTATNTVTATIAVGERPINIAVSPNGASVYVTNQFGNSVSVISTSTNSVTTIPVGANPYGVAFSPNGQQVYVTYGGATGMVAVLNASTNAIITTIAVGSGAGGVSFSPDGSRAYIENSGAGTVSVINTATDTIIQTITVGNTPLNSGICSNGNALLATGFTFKANTSGALACTQASGASGAAGPVFTGGTLKFAGANIVSALPVTLLAAGGTFDTSGNNATLSGGISGVGGLTKTGLGTLTLSGSGVYSGPTMVNAGVLQAGASNAFSANSAYTVAGGAVLDLNSFNQTIGSLAGTGNVTLGSATLTAGADNTSTTFAGAISGTGGLTKTGTGVLTLTGNNTYTGFTTINAGGQLKLTGAGSISSSKAVIANGTFDISGLSFGGGTLITSLSGAGTGVVNLGSNNLTLTNANGTFAGTIQDGGARGALVLASGKEILTGINTYTGSTGINGGTLEVDGSITSSQLVAANFGGTLSGTGTIGSPITSITTGSTLAPGSASNPTGTLTMTGNLALQSGAIYLVQVTPAAAASVNVGGTATLGGANVNAAFANGAYISKRYTILTAGSVSGTFGVLTNGNLPTNFTDTLSYDATHAYLNLTLNFTPPPTGPTAPNFGGGLNINQQNVANTLVNYFNTTGGIPMVYGTLTPAGLTQASGELATGTQQTTFDAMTLFMGLMTDPFMNRNGGAGSMPGASGYAEEGDASAYASTRKTDAFAMVTKAPPAPFEQRWSVWAAGFGGAQSTSGNAIVGSNDTTSAVYGTAIGADYLFSPNTIAGFALAGGGTNFSVANSGSGRSDLFQAGAYLRHTEGPAYISGALAYGWQDVTTNRTVTAGGFDQLRAEFNADAWSGRVEGGYRFVAPWTGGIGITPYAAGQFTTFDLPTYAEQVVTGLPTFALTYAGKSVTDARSELGIRTDKSFALQDGLLTLRTRFAWSHDYDPNRSIAATFQALPGTSFVVNGAAQASDSALTTASLEMKWRNGWSAAATFEGEFSNGTSSYAGKGVVRYQW